MMVDLTTLKMMAGALVNCGNGNSACDTGLPEVKANYDKLHIILQLFFGIIGGLAVIIVIIAALKLGSSQGNPQEAAKARDEIIYAFVGLALALSAEVIVTFVLKRV